MRSAKKPKQRKKKGLSKTAAFIAAYRVTASVTRAAAAARIERRLHYRWLEDDEQYRASFEAAKEEAGQALEDEAIRRAHEGVEEPVIYQGALCHQWEDVVEPEWGEVVGQRRGDKPLIVRKYSDQLLTFLLKGFKPEKYKDRGAIEHSGPGGGPIPIDARLATLTDAELEQLTAIAEKLTASGNAPGGSAPASA